MRKTTDLRSPHRHGCVGRGTMWKHRTSGTPCKTPRAQALAVTGELADTVVQRLCVESRARLIARRLGAAARAVAAKKGLRHTGHAHGPAACRSTARRRKHQRDSLGQRRYARVHAQWPLQACRSYTWNLSTTTAQATPRQGFPPVLGRCQRCGRATNGAGLLAPSTHGVKT